MSSKQLFNIRVYGLLINNSSEVLVSDEQEHGMRFSKFPGGGLEYGEGLPDGLKREFMEECGTEVEIVSHFYTTDFFVESAVALTGNSDYRGSQLICVYYLVKPVSPLNFTVKTRPFDFDGDGDMLQSFRWVKITDLLPADLTFPIDRHVAKLIKQGL